MIFTQFTCWKYGKSDLHAYFVCPFIFPYWNRTYGNTYIKKRLIRFCDTDKSRTDKVRRKNNSHTWKRSLTIRQLVTFPSVNLLAITNHQIDTFWLEKSKLLEWQQQNPIKCRSFALFVENSEWKTFRRAKVLDSRVPFARKFIKIRLPYFQEVNWVSQHVMLYPRHEIFLIYLVFHHKINLFKVTRHFLCFICNLFYLKWTNVLKYWYYHPTPW